MKNIGGQAVIEGVMMKAAKAWTVAVRDQRGEIHVKKEGLLELPSPLKRPILRGIAALIQALSLGIKALSYSAEKAVGAEEKSFSPFTMAMTITVSVALGIVLFLLLPLYLTRLLGIVFSSVQGSSFVFNLVDGLIRIVFFLIYVASISFMKDIRRVFEYHGAEHKVIYTYEAGEALTVENARRHSTLHPRCGTSFLLVVMVVSILIFSFIPKEWSLGLKFISRIVLIPLIAGLSYEFIRFSAKRVKDSSALSRVFFGVLIRPGLCLQRITTRQPDDAQIEVAIRALNEVLSMDRDA